MERDVCEIINSLYFTKRLSKEKDRNMNICVHIYVHNWGQTSTRVNHQIVGIKIAEIEGDAQSPRFVPRGVLWSGKRTAANTLARARESASDGLATGLF